MKKIIVFISLFLSLTASAQNDAIEDTTSQPAITKKGKPVGKIKEMMMNKDGGNLISEDGIVELIIPSGALSKKTKISIQPMTNLMPNGNGLAYRLEPSGIQFQKPVQIVFHYDPEKSEDSSELFMGIAMQDEKGQWYSLNKFTLDTVAKTINGNINHFSTWATYDWLALRADAERLKVKKSQVLVIKGVFSDPEQAKFYSEELSSLRSWKPPHTTIWRVNGIIKGNPEVGTLRRGKAGVSWGHWNGYWAPDNVPDPNPVTISVYLVGASFTIRDQIFKNLPPLTAKILIYDNAYEIVYTNSYEDQQKVVNDTATFIVTLDGKKSKLEEMYNSTYKNQFISDGDCKYNWINQASCTGFIHLVGAKTINVQPKGDTRIVDIYFTAVMSVLPIVVVTCPKVPPFTRPSFPLQAYPQRITFKDNGQFQEYIDYSNGLFGEVGFKVTIMPIKDD